MFNGLKTKLARWIVNAAMPPAVPTLPEEKKPRSNALEAFARQFGSPYSLDKVNNRVFMRQGHQDIVQQPVGMDAAAFDNSMGNMKAQFSISQQTISPLLLDWFSNQSFIGYQVASLLAQHWLIDKACTVPAQDAVRQGYRVTMNDGGDELDPKVLAAIKKADIKYCLNENLVQFVRMGRIFGIRIALFLIEGMGDDFYSKPFNIDGIPPGSYKGIVQVDPYWITPELDLDSGGNPASIHFYEPTWWRVNGVRYHRTHLIIMRVSEPADILKPTYFYGGIPVPQKIFERVYGAERTASEAPDLVMTKRTNALHVSLEEALADQATFEDKMRWWAYYRSNYGIKVLDLDEKFEQFDTTLAGLDETIMTQYQLVAAAAEVPATKLLGTSPKGFNATGEYEEASYHESLESIQTHTLSPLIQRHHMLLIKSEIAPKFGIEPFETEIVWEPLDSMTAKEEAEVNKIKADTGLVLMQSGAISGEDERNRIIADANSGYDGLKNLEGIADDPIQQYLDTENDPAAEVLGEPSSKNPDNETENELGYK